MDHQLTHCNARANAVVVPRIVRGVLVPLAVGPWSYGGGAISLLRMICSSMTSRCQ
jgi:hypothetical protein